MYKNIYIELHKNGRFKYEKYVKHAIKLIHQKSKWEKHNVKRLCSPFQREGALTVNGPFPSGLSVVLNMDSRMADDCVLV